MGRLPVRKPWLPLEMAPNAAYMDIEIKDVPGMEGYYSEWDYSSPVLPPPWRNEYCPGFNGHIKGYCPPNLWPSCPTLNGG